MREFFGRWLGLVLFAALIFPGLFPGFCGADELNLENIKNDYRNFYLDQDNLIKLGIGISGAAIFANTSIDRDIRDYYQDNIRSNTTDDFSKVLKVPGVFYVTTPLLLGTNLVFKDSPAGEWAGRSLRAIIVGAPSALFIGWATGGAKPTEGTSKWNPFHHGDGLSDHAFIGAVPFITAAGMTENRYLSGLLYGLSVLPALSRINDDKHYFSQAALGWYLAYRSCRAVDKTGSSNKVDVTVMPVPHGGLGIALYRTF